MDGWGLPVAVTLAFASLGGAWIFAMIAPIRESFWRGACAISVGFLAALFLSPAVCRWVGWTAADWEMQHATHLVIGLLGNPLCRLILSDGAKEIWARMTGRPRNGESGPTTKDDASPKAG